MIYALKGDPDQVCDILASLREGAGRFGWSYIKTADLHELQTKIDALGYEAGLTNEEKDCYHAFLLDLKADDYVVYINVPEWGKCTVARVTGPYFWRFDSNDFNHRFPVDPDSVAIFDRNDAIVHPALSARLKLRGRYWRIYLQDEFENLVKALKGGVVSQPRTPQTNLAVLAKAIKPLLISITAQIQYANPNYDLEALLAEVLKNVPGVKEAKWQGGAGDHGADLIVVFDGSSTVKDRWRPATL